MRTTTALLTLALGAAACSEASGPIVIRQDSGVIDAGGADGGFRADAIPPDAQAPDATTSDAGAGDAFVDPRPDGGGGPADANLLRDAAPHEGTGDESVRGTALAGLRIPWDAPVELCARWREGRPIADELADKALVTVWPASRPSLGSGHLAAATVPRVFVRRGPFGDLQWDAAPRASSLADYRLYPQQGGAVSLGAEIEHDLGPAGVLIEAFSVYRTTGDTREVTLGYEHAFLLRGAAIAEPVPLEDCAGVRTLDDAVHVLTAERGGQHMTLVRYARTVEANAGSAPVHLRGLDVHFAGGHAAVSTQDFWAMTYAAQHHNWEDASVFDFTRDLARWSLVFEPFRKTGRAPVTEALELLALRNIDAFGPAPEVSLVLRDFEANVTRTETWSAAPRWRRVDSTALARELSCAGGAVLTLNGPSVRTFQVLTCPRAQAPGFTVEAVVPVWFAEENDSAGQRFGNASPVTLDGRPGFRVAIGNHRLSITKGQEPYYHLTLEDAAQVLEDSVAEPSRLWPTSRDAEVRYTAAGGIEVKLLRRYVAQGSGRSAIYAPARFEVHALGREWRIEAWDRMDYENTHHNWNDRLTARAADGTVLEWRARFDQQRHTLRITDAGGAELLPETTVTAP